MQENSGRIRRRVGGEPTPWDQAFTKLESVRELLVNEKIARTVAGLAGVKESLKGLKLQMSVDKGHQQDINKLIEDSLLKTNTKVDELGKDTSTLQAKVGTLQKQQTHNNGAMGGILRRLENLERVRSC
jgi:hypothetical protein